MVKGSTREALSVDRQAAVAYDVLGVPHNAATDEIRRAYHRLAREQHPDRSCDAPEGHQAFVRLQQAWEVLREPEQRRRYDAALDAERYALLRASALTHDVDLSDMEYAEDGCGGGVWSFACRCGAMFKLTESQLSAGIETLECHSCTLSIRPLYRMADEDR
jgi:diphthamide biosynthesis protein 4